MYLNEIYIFWNYDLIYMILDNLTMYLTLIPRKWGLFIGTLIPSQWALVPKLVLSGAS